MKYCFKLGFLLLLTWSCQNRPNKIVLNGKEIDTDTIKFFSIQEYPKNGQNRLSSLLGLDSLEKAGDWLEIRISRYYSDAEPIRLFVIKRRSDLWSGYAIEITPDYNEKNNSMRYIPKIVGHTPIGGWDNLGKQLLSMGVLEIDKEIPLGEYDISNDADDITVEYASKDGYRRYFITEPEKHKTPGKIRITKIAQFIEKELAFKNFATLSRK